MPSKPSVILYVEQNRILLQTVRDVLEFAGWYESCSDEGYAAAFLRKPNNLIVLVDTIRRLLAASATP